MAINQNRRLTVQK